MEPTFREYAHGSSDYQKALILRYCILARDCSIPDSAVEFVYGLHEDEKNQFLLGAFDGSQLLATLNLQEKDGALLLRQFAVHEKQQGTGLGMKLLRFAHAFARKRGYKRIVLHARMNVIGFYEKGGYVLTDKRYIYPDLTLAHMYIDL